MKQFFYLPVVCVLALAACTGSFKKGDTGLEYKIISKGAGKTISYGEYMQLHITQIYGGTKDTVLMDSHDFMPRVELFDSVSTPMAYFKILRQVKKGDSVIIRMLTDSAFKENPGGMPPYMKLGTYFYTHLKIVNIFQTREQADSANNAERNLAKPRVYAKQFAELEKTIAGNKQQIEADGKIIADYLAKNNIKAEKTNWGTYIATEVEGTGAKADKNSIVTVNYTGRPFDGGDAFDSNVDPKFQHVKPYDVSLSDLKAVIPGWIDVLSNLKKGSKVKAYIPSSLGYGVNGNGERIKPNTILIFDIEALDVATEEDFVTRQKAMQEQIQKALVEAEKKRTDSIQKATNK